MAAVTVNSVYYNVVGSKRSQLYSVTGTSGDTLTTGLYSVKGVNVQPVATNPPTITFTGNPVVITFTSGGVFTAVPIEVIGA